MTEGQRYGIGRVSRARKIAEGLSPTGIGWLKEAKDLRRSHGINYQRYASARRARLTLVPSHTDLASGLIVDLGANVGDWTASVCKALPGVQILAVEPVPQLHERLATRFRSCPNVTVDGRAVDARSGLATFHLTRSEVFGSLLAPDGAVDGVYGPATEVIDEVSVPTATLDEIVGGRSVSLLKLDVQGAELRVIDGGDRTLAETQAVLVEMLFVTHYRNGSTVSTVHDALVERGFVAWGWHAPARTVDGRLLWADMCYARPGRASRRPC